MRNGNIKRIPRRDGTCRFGDTAIRRIGSRSRMRADYRACADVRECAKRLPRAENFAHQLKDFRAWAECRSTAKTLLRPQKFAHTRRLPRVHRRSRISGVDSRACVDVRACTTARASAEICAATKRLPRMRRSSRMQEKSHACT